MTTKYPTLCAGCAFLRADKSSCRAFPEGIPDDIVVWGGDHTKPVPGDGGIRYERAPGQKAALNEIDWRSVQ